MCLNCMRNNKLEQTQVFVLKMYHSYGEIGQHLVVHCKTTSCLYILYLELRLGFELMQETERQVNKKERSYISWWSFFTLFTLKADKEMSILYVNLMKQQILTFSRIRNYQGILALFFHLVFIVQIKGAYREPAVSNGSSEAPLSL